MAGPRAKKLLRRIVLSLLLLLILAVAALLGYEWLKYRKAKSTRYPEFGVNIPDHYSIHGIDVSRYQDVIAWEEVRRMNVRNIRLGFAFIKATEGIDNTDPQFHRNWKKSKASGIIRGAYHFFLPIRDGRMQAENFIRSVPLQSGDLPPVLDVEHNYGASCQQVRREVKRWLQVVEFHYGAKPIIYTNVEFYRNCLGREFDAYPLWIAHYESGDEPGIRRPWIFWQHTDRGRVNGIVHAVDFNVFSGDSAQFRQLLLK